MRELRVIEIRVSTSEAPPLVVLEEVDGDGRLLPIWMSHGGASAIFGATEEPDPERPSIHDLAKRIADEAAVPLVAAQIVAYDDGQFFAELVFGDQSLPARPSDAIALALRAGCPIRCADAVLDEAGVNRAPSLPEPVGDDEHADEEVERFREFLDTVTPEDFSGDEGKP